MRKMVLWFVGAMFAVSAQLSLGADYRAGEHYRILPQEIRTADPSKIEVIEMFGYWCPHCNNLEVDVVHWKKSLPDDVAFQPVPVIFRKNETEVAKSYYIAKSLGILDQAHQGMFDMIHKQDNMPVTRDQLARFFKSYGVSDSDFKKTYGSFDISRGLSTGRKKAVDYQISTVPTMIVNGKYIVPVQAEGGHKAMLDVVDYLVEKERKAMQ